MSKSFLFVVLVVAVIVVLVAYPKLRRVLHDWLGRHLASVTDRLLGPLDPKGFVKVLLRAAKAKTTGTLTGSFLPNHIRAGVSPVEFEQWGPFASRVGPEAERALRELAQSNESLMLLGRPTVLVTCDPLAKPRQPRFVMEIVSPDQLDATTYRPSRSGTRDVTPIMPRRSGSAADLTEPLVEIEVVIGGKPYGTFEFGEGQHAVGRDDSCALVIPERSVSKRDAVIVVTRRYATIQDLDSRNGVFVGNVRAEVPLLLSPGDLVMLSGNVQLRILRSVTRRKAA